MPAVKNRVTTKRAAELLEMSILSVQMGMRCNALPIGSCWKAEGRKFALRMGQLASDQAHYVLNEKMTKKLFRGAISISELKESDFDLDLKQKGVDMRIGIDISSLAFKKQVDRIILISGDSDFVPAAKQARREGIDFILDPMRSPIKEDLFEHIDGMRTKAPKEPQVKKENSK